MRSRWAQCHGAERRDDCDGKHRSPNGVIDDAETVWINFALQNAGNTALANVIATLGIPATCAHCAELWRTGRGCVGSRDVFHRERNARRGHHGDFNLTDGATSLGTATYSFRLAANAVPRLERRHHHGGKRAATAEWFLDPNEVVTVSFGISNVGEQAFLATSPRPCWPLAESSRRADRKAMALSRSVAASLRLFLTGTGAIGSTLTATLQLQDDANYGTLTYTFL